jgi:hypothetical protein
MTHRNDSIVKVGDKLGLVSTEGGVAPALTHRIKIYSIEYQILDVQPFNTGSVVMLFELHARK